MNNGNSKYKSTMLSCFSGLFVQAIVNNFLPILFIALQDVYGIGYENLGRLILINFVTQLITDVLTPKIISKTGYRKAAIACQFFAAVGLVLMSVLPGILPSPYIGMVISIIVYAFASGLMEVILSPIVELLPGDNKRGVMALLHSFYCWGQAVTTIVTTALIFTLGNLKWAYIPLIWAVVPLINSLAFARVPIIEPKPQRRKETLSSLLKNRNFRTFMLIMVCSGACEIAMAQWASMFAQKALGVSKVFGDLAGPCAFAIFMGLGRVLYAKFADRISFRKTVIVMSLLCFLCYMVTALCHIPVVSLITCAFCGFTVSLFWPGAYSAGAKAFPTGYTLMFSIFAMCGDTGCALGPWILGLVAEKAGLNAGFASAAVFPAILFFTVLFVLKEKA